MRLEMEVLIACGRSIRREDPGNLIPLLRSNRIRWNLLLRLAERHGMLPLLSARLTKSRDALPAAIRQKLEAAELANALRMLSTVSELISLIAEFRAAGLEALPYKGPVLGLQLYGSLALRQAGDLDLLVRKRDVDSARRILLSRGYQPVYFATDSRRLFMKRSRYSESFTHPEGCPLELHWAFTNGDVALNLGLDDLAPSLQRLELDGFDLPVCRIEDLLMILCVHGSKHRWDRLEWLCGVAEGVRNAEDLDWDRLISRASHLGVRRMLLLGLLLSHSLLGAPVPARVLEQAERDSCVRDLAKEVPDILAAPAMQKGALSLPVDLFRFKLRERLRDRARFVLYRLTTPSNPEEWDVLAIGRFFVPKHAFTRPFRLLAGLGHVGRYAGQRMRARDVSNQGYG